MKEIQLSKQIVDEITIDSTLFSPYSDKSIMDDLEKDPQSLAERATEIIKEALFYGTITFSNEKTTHLKPETVLNLAKALSTSKSKVNLKESTSAPVDFYSSESTQSNSIHLEFPFMEDDLLKGGK